MENEREGFIYQKSLSNEGKECLVWCYLVHFKGKPASVRLKGEEREREGGRERVGWNETSIGGTKLEIFN